MTDAQRDPETSDQGGQTIGLERLIAFSDAIFSIAITLLALDIRLPKTEGHLSNAELFAQLLVIWPKYYAYFISFVIVAIFWIKHHVSFRYIRAYDDRLMFLNLLLLLIVAVIPFPASVISEQRNSVAIALYAGTMACGFLVSALMWWHATRGNRLVVPDLSPEVRRNGLIAPLLAVAVFLLSIVLTLYSDHWARLSWLLLIPMAGVKSWTRKKP
jgi:uncharacterized membrane protein